MSEGGGGGGEHLALTTPPRPRSHQHSNHLESERRHEGKRGDSIGAELPSLTLHVFPHQFQGGAGYPEPFQTVVDAISAVINLDVFQLLHADW